MFKLCPTSGYTPYGGYFSYVWANLRLIWRWNCNETWLLIIFWVTMVIAIWYRLNNCKRLQSFVNECTCWLHSQKYLRSCLSCFFVLQTRLLGYHVVTFSIQSAAMPPQKCLVSPQNPLFSHQIISSNSFLDIVIVNSLIASCLNT